MLYRTALEEVPPLFTLTTFMPVQPAVVKAPFVRIESGPDNAPSKLRAGKPFRVSDPDVTYAGRLAALFCANCDVLPLSALAITLFFHALTDPLTKVTVLVSAASNQSRAEDSLPGVHQLVNESVSLAVIDVGVTPEAVDAVDQPLRLPSVLSAAVSALRVSVC